MSGKNVNRILLYVIYFFMAVFGVYCSLIVFGEKYAQTPVHTMALIIFTAIGVLIALLVYIIPKTKKFLFIGSILLLAVVIFILRWQIYGGMLHLINKVIDVFSDYYNVSIYRFTFTDKITEYGSCQAFLAVLCVVFGFLYMSIMLHKVAIGIPVFFCLITYFIPATLEQTVSLPVFVENAFFVTFLIVDKSDIKQKDFKNIAFSSIFAAIFMGIVCAIVIMVTGIIKPGKEYTLSSFQQNLKGKLVFSPVDLANYLNEKEISFLNFFQSQNENKIGAGDLTFDKFSFTDNPVFYVRAPKNSGTIYLKAYEAAEYTRKKWKEIPDENYKNYEDMFAFLTQSGFYPQNSTAASISHLIEEQKADFYFEKYKLQIIKLLGDKYSYLPENYLSIDNKDISSDDFIKKYDKNISYKESQINKKNVLHSFEIVEWKKYFSLASLYELGRKENEDNTYFQAEKKYRTFVYDNYLEVNTSCEKWIRDELIKQIKSSDYSLATGNGKARFIKDTINYFNKNYTYTIEPLQASKEQDFVEFFLKESKEGFCVYFASATVMILRSAGIPARYVEGYVLPVGLHDLGRTVENNEDYVEFPVTDRYTHAWVEIYVDGIGWVAIDSTPGNDSEWIYSEADIPKDTSSEEVTTEEVTTEETSSEELTTEETVSDETQESKSDEEKNTTKTEVIDESDENGPQETKDDGEKSGDSYDDGDSDGKDGFELSLEKIKTVFYYILKILAYVSITLIFVLFVFIRKKYVEEKRNKLYNVNCGYTTNERVILQLQYFDKIMKYDKKILMPTESYSDFFKRTGINVPDDVEQIIERVLYAGNEITKDEAMKALIFIDNIRNSVYGKLNWLQKIWFKYFLVY